MIVETIVAVFIVVGSGFTLIGSIGLARLGDAYSRLHGPTKATTLGLSALLLASVVHFSGTGGLSVHEILVTAFLFLTAPVSAHMLARAALHTRVPSITRPPAIEYQDAFPETVGAGAPVPPTTTDTGDRPS